MVKNKKSINLSTKREVNIIHMIHEAKDQNKERRNAIKDQWKRIIAWNDHLPADLRNFRIYHDGLLADISKEAMLKEVKKCRKVMSLENVVWQLLKKGAKIEGTEDRFLFYLFGYLLDLIRIVKTTPESNAKKTLLKALDIGLDKVLEKRDQFIAGQIDRTLLTGETALLYIGDAHDVESHLPKTIKTHSWFVFKNNKR
jgi:hypothetical protein